MKHEELKQIVEKLNAQVDHINNRLDEIENKISKSIRALKVLHKNEQSLYSEMSLLHDAFHLIQEPEKKSFLSYLKGFISTYHIIIIANSLFFLSAVALGWLISNSW